MRKGREIYGKRGWEGEIIYHGSHCIGDLGFQLEGESTVCAGMRQKSQSESEVLEQEARPACSQSTGPRASRMESKSYSRRVS